MRHLGTTDLIVHPLCLGGNVFGWTLDEPASHAVLDAYADGGGTFVDTSSSYSSWVPGNAGGESEAIIGRWLRGRADRDAIVVATKCGHPGREAPAGGLAPAAIHTTVDASLTRLGVERIDLLYAHEDDPRTPLAETLAAFAELVAAGKVRAIAASNYSAARLLEALELCERHGFPRFVALQPEYNLLDRAGFEAELEGLSQREGLAVVPYYGLASGFLTGKYRPGAPLPDTPRAPGVRARYMNERGFAVLDVLDRVAARHDATPAEIALAWLIEHPAITAPIASATSPEHVRELLGAAEIELDQGEWAELAHAGAA